MIYPALYYLPGSDGDCVALLASHVDDLLYTYLPEGEEVVAKFLQKFELGSRGRSLPLLRKAVQPGARWNHHDRCDGQYTRGVKFAAKITQ